MIRGIIEVPQLKNVAAAMLVTSRCLSNRNGASVTMPHSTLPLFSLQLETKTIPLTQGKVAIVDAADYEWLMQWKWHALKSPKAWYAVRNETLPDGRRRSVQMHRVIMDAPPGIEVDHKDRDGLNNTRENLRFATSDQNQHNRSLQSNNTSGYKGVSWKKKNGKWTAQIRWNGKRIYLGLFTTAEEAAAAYDEAARKYHGEYARTNGMNLKEV